MFPGRFFGTRFFCDRFWAKVGATAPGAPFRLAAGQVYSAGAAAGESYSAGAPAGQTYNAGAAAGEVN